jgi:hypothetical protein
MKQNIVPRSFMAINNIVGPIGFFLSVIDIENFKKRKNGGSPEIRTRTLLPAADF